MLQLQFIPMSKLQSMKKKVVRKPKILNEYQEYLRQLKPKQAGQITLRETDKPATIKSRLQRASKSLDMKLKIRRYGNEIVFWKE